MTRTINIDSLTVRRAGAQDAAQLVRLAALDSADVPSGDVLLAESSGQLLAALSLADGHAVADPFEHTAEMVALLRLRAEQLVQTEAPKRIASWRDWATSVPSGIQSSPSSSK
ncbi:MAG TPA: hypothetical protein VK304_12735 [Thermoleophilaceae bacterium]|nr:hypothetical protein [Thermoleophilaceae bacterium]